MREVIAARSRPRTSATAALLRSLLKVQKNSSLIKQTQFIRRDPVRIPSVCVPI